MVVLNDIEVSLRVEDIGTGAEVTVLTEGEKMKKEDTGFKEDTFKIQIQLPNGEPRRWIMNKTSQRYYAEKFGMDTKKWVGQKITISWVQQKVGREMKKIFYPLELVKKMKAEDTEVTKKGKTGLGSF